MRYISNKLKTDITSTYKVKRRWSWMFLLYVKWLERSIACIEPRRFNPGWKTQQVNHVTAGFTLEKRLSYSPSLWGLSWGPGPRHECCRAPGHICLFWTGPGWQTCGSGVRRPAQSAGWGHTHGSRALQTAAGGWWRAWYAPAHTGQCRTGLVSLLGCDL